MVGVCHSYIRVYLMIISKLQWWTVTEKVFILPCGSPIYGGGKKGKIKTTVADREFKKKKNQKLKYTPAP